MSHQPSSIRACSKVRFASVFWLFVAFCCLTVSGASAEEIYAILDGQLQRLGTDESSITPVAPFDLEVESMAFTPEGQLLAMSFDRAIYEIDLVTAQATQLLPAMDSAFVNYSQLTAAGSGWCYVLRVSLISGPLTELVLLNIDTGVELVVGQPRPAEDGATSLSIRTLATLEGRLIGLGVQSMGRQLFEIGESTAEATALSSSFVLVPSLTDSDSEGNVWVLGDLLTAPPGQTLQAINAETGRPVPGKASYLFRQVIPFAVKRGATPPCQSTETALCFLDGQFQVEVTWRDSLGRTGVGKVVPGTTDNTGLMWFFSDDNWELMIKVLDGCEINDRVWVFLAGTTNVEYTVTVTDTRDGSRQMYQNPLDTTAQTVLDTDAFATCPGGS